MKDIKKVIVLGSGALKIGQAGEFDYSGSQALKALREEGIETVLVNPNIATVQTSKGIADKVYFLPVTSDFVKEVIIKEKPQGILLAFGGQTALNCGVELYESGFLEKHGVRVLGTPVQSIIDTEDRELFVERLDEIDVKTIKSEAVSSVEDAVKAASQIGYPVILRAAYALGGLGSGFCDNEKELIDTAAKSFSFSPQVLVEKSLKGWKEIEFEVIRDKSDKCMIICDMENFDPLGIHTGESIVVAPTQTLSEKDIAFLHELSIKIVRHLGIVGECNIQYAYAPDSSDYRVIEVNARLSRSSALASKATGYPLAFVAAKIALGYDLCQIGNASVAPHVDYIVCKIPRWDLAKFKGVSREIGTSMKSVGEVMAIGKNFEEAFQKGLRMIGQGANGFVCNKPFKTEDLDYALSHPTDTRVFAIAAALQSGYSVGKIYSLTKINEWFLQALKNIEDSYRTLESYRRLEDVSDTDLLNAKKLGFSDIQISRIFGCSETEVSERRRKSGLRPFVKRINTLILDSSKQSNYLYTTYNSDRDDIDFVLGKKSVMVLGSGAYRIGSSVEFDWCGVNAVNTVRRAGYDAIMVNCNPETVSTDYDISDRLYFEELSLESVVDIYRIENPFGVIVSVGGQIPNNLALPLTENGIRILGTRAEDIDRAEDRNKFSSIVDKLGIDQPLWNELTSLESVDEFTDKVGFPVLVRPSYVLSGAAMNVCYSREDLHNFLELAVEVSESHPVVVSSFLQRCREMEYDAVADEGKVLIQAISEHVEFAGVHSGDATIQFPPQKIYGITVARIRKIASKIASELHITGPFNIQFLVSNDYIKVIECNLRSSRTFPFVSKLMGVNFIELATRCMMGEKPAAPEVDEFDIEYVGVKASQFSFSRLGQADPVAGVDMASTGEVGCIGDSFDEALLKAMLSVGHKIPQKGSGILISSGDALQKAHLLEACRILADNGYKIYATGGTHRYLKGEGVDTIYVLWPSEAGDNISALDLIKNGEVQLVINIPRDFSRYELTNGYKVRRAAIDFNIPLITNSRLATAYIKAFTKLDRTQLLIKSWDEYSVD